MVETEVSTVGCGLDFDGGKGFGWVASGYGLRRSKMKTVDLGFEERFGVNLRVDSLERERRKGDWGFAG